MMMIANFLTAVGLTVLMTFSSSLTTNSDDSSSDTLFIAIEEISHTITDRETILNVTYSPVENFTITCIDNVENPPYSDVELTSNGLRQALCRGQIVDEPSHTLNFVAENRTIRKGIGIYLNKSLPIGSYFTTPIVPVLKSSVSSVLVYNTGGNTVFRVRYSLPSRSPVNITSVEFNISTILINQEKGVVQGHSENNGEYTILSETTSDRFRMLEIQMNTARNNTSGFIELYAKYTYPQTSFISFTDAWHFITLRPPSQHGHLPVNFIGFMDFNRSVLQNGSIPLNCGNVIKYDFSCLAVSEGLTNISLQKIEADGSRTLINEVKVEAMPPYVMILYTDVMRPSDFVGQLPYECLATNSQGFNKTQVFLLNFS